MNFGMLEHLEFLSPGGDSAGAGSNDDDDGQEADGGAEGDGDGKGADGGSGEGGGKENPLLPDLRKWKTTARDQKRIIAEKDREIARLKAGNEDELQALRDQHEADLTRRERRIEVAELAADAGVKKPFLTLALQEAGDDDSPTEIVENAKAAQAAYDQSRGLAGDGQADGGDKKEAFGGKGGASPDGKGGAKRIFTAKEIEEADPLDVDLNNEIAAAIAEGRIKR